METLKKMKLNYVIEAIVMIVIGVVLIFWTEASLLIMARALAILLVIAGVIFVFSYFLHKERSIVMSGGFAMGVIIAAIGVWIFLKPDTFTDFIPKLFGVFILLSGLMNLGQTISLVSYRYSLWWISLILAVGTIGMGAFLLFNPKDAKEIAVTIIGIFLVYDGITNLWTISRVSKYAKRVNQEMNAVDVEAVVEDVDKK
ncbi:Uncharacterized membrane protein HdeD, DUF308 family [Butyrivibrio proteoclasticus]|uniref:Uncharacterized membrane protein HdeD, DUF308 family n=1 Tax=Butyrivibrio proteoclasticus TaxID=43305 RepID=A0A1I5T6Z9_9FIRM|nr:DUF308 domain-containing protein [Butyrivibrio proteoclasticus]SFP78810.1 Uncharacterized membrane protein HdeD, DUF308 family [Butyrivibrio proteoclasticus]